MNVPMFDFNILTFMRNHKCINNEICTLMCIGTQPCLREALNEQEVSHEIETHAKFIMNLGVQVGDNYYYENQLLSDNKKEAIKSIRILCEAKYLSANVETNGIVILDDDYDLGDYSTTLYDCHITEDNRVIFDHNVKYIKFDTYEDALEYALTTNRF